VLSSYPKRKVVIDSKISILVNRLRGLDIPKDLFIELSSEIDEMAKDLEKLNFKAKRAEVDKGIITNILKGNVAELELKNKIIEEQIAFKEKLLANVNHELRTPLNAIIGMSSLLQDTELNEDQKEYINIIKRSGDNLFTIINDFLTMSSMRVGKLRLKVRPFNLSEVLSDLDTIFKRRTEEKGIEFKISMGLNTPNSFLGDSTRIYQILQNLLTNSIKFTTNGSVKVHVEVIKDYGELKIIEFSVEDTGIGIPKEKQETIFDSFTQAHTAGNRDYMGTGLGLNIVRALTQLMDGEITLDSEENSGTKICIRIPLKIIQNEVQVESVKEEEISIPANWRAKKFLMIEDNKANIIYARELFKKWDLDIVFMEDYTSGLKEANENYYNLILSDLKLPDGNGIDLLKAIRANENSACHKTKMAVITASISQSDKDRAEELEISAYIEKPFIPVKLLTELHSILEGAAPIKNRIILDDQTENTETEDRGMSLILGQLRSISQDEKVQLEFVDIFLDQLDVDLQRLKDVVAEENFLQIYKCAHKIKSTVKIFKLEKMSNEISAIEQISNSTKNMDEINQIFKSFYKNAQTNLPKLQKIKAMLEEKTILV